MIRWSAITLRAGVMPHGGTKEKETRIDRDNERTRGGMKRGCYVCMCPAYTHMWTRRETYREAASCAHMVHTSALRERGKE